MLRTTRVATILALLLSFATGGVTISRAGECTLPPASEGGRPQILAAVGPVIVAEVRQTEESTWRYNTEYIFGFSRALADSTLHPAAKTPFFVFTVVFDVVFLVPAVIGGLFG